MKSILLTIASTLLFCFGLVAQNLVIKKTYYDIYQTKLKAEWQQTANGYINGYYKEYYPSGKLYIDRIVKTLDVYPYWSIDLKWKVYTEAGDLKWSITQNDKREFQGEQISYMFSGPNLVKRSRAVFESGKLITFELYRKNGTKSLDLNTKSFYKTFDENDVLMDNVKINSKGEFTGKLYQDKSNTILEVLDGKIQKVYESNPDPKNGNWNVYRLGNDTLISSAKDGDTYFKRYYLDTVRVGLIEKPNINIELTQYQDNEFGLDFVNPAFLCCALSHKYYYDIKFYNRELQTFIKKEIRDIKTDRLISLSIPGKDIYYHENGKIKKVVMGKDNWEEFDENGKLINSYEMSKMAWYEYNFNIAHAQKLEYLRNLYGWNKLLIDLTEYRKSKTSFIASATSGAFYESNGEYSVQRPYKISGSKILIIEEEAIALRSLLENRDRFISYISLDGNDYARGLFDNVAQEGTKSYQVSVKNEYKNIYSAYSLCINHLLDSLTKIIIEKEPGTVLSPEWKTPKNIDIKKDLKVVEELSKENFSDKRFDFNYPPDEWINYNSNYLILINNYNNMVVLFNSVVKNNPQKAEKKLKDKTDLNEILSILNTYEY